MNAAVAKYVAFARVAAAQVRHERSDLAGALRFSP